MHLSTAWFLFAWDQPREAIFAARDRGDETVDHIRSVRTDRWLYIRNFLPKRPHLQPNNYKDHKRCYIALREARAAGLLNPVQEALFAAERPHEELYDNDADPWEVRNLAGDLGHSAQLSEMRQRLDAWMEQTADQGRNPEPAAQYESDMAAYLGEGKKAGLRSEIEANIALMKRWAAEGN
jgi:arylsulfatase A-like enzyme